MDFSLRGHSARSPVEPTGSYGFSGFLSLDLKIPNCKTISLATSYVNIQLTSAHDEE